MIVSGQRGESRGQAGDGRQWFPSSCRGKMDIRAPIKCPRSTLQGSDLQTESWSQAKARDGGAEEGAFGGGGPSPARLSALTGACPHGACPRGGVSSRSGSSPGRVLTRACPHWGGSSSGRVLTGRVLTGAGPHLGVSSRGRVLAERVLMGGRVLTGHTLPGACLHRVSAAQSWGTLTLRDCSVLPAYLPTCFRFWSSLSFVSR